MNGDLKTLFASDLRLFLSSKHLQSTNFMKNRCPSKMMLLFCKWLWVNAKPNWNTEIRLIKPLGMGFILSKWFRFSICSIYALNKSASLTWIWVLSEDDIEIGFKLWHNNCCFRREYGTHFLAWCPTISE